MTLLAQAFRFLASLKLAVIILLGFTVLLGAATFYESHSGTAMAQQNIYKTLWFDFLILLLGVNVACAALIRLPWKKRHLGFVVTHLGILVILLGSMITRQFGVEGQIMLREGETADSIRVDETVFAVSAPERDVSLETAPRFAEEPIPAGKRYEYRLEGTDIVCYVDKFLHNPQFREVVTGDGEGSHPAIHVSVFPPSSPEPHREWLFAADGHGHNDTINLGVARITFHGVKTGGEMDKLIHTRNAANTHGHEISQMDIYTDAADGSLRFNLKTASGELGGGPVPMGRRVEGVWRDVAVQVDRYYPNARIEREMYDAGRNAKGPQNNPVVHVRVESGGEFAEGYVGHNSPKAFRAGGETCLVEFGQRSVPLGFTLNLIDFRAPRYPGTNRPKRFESDVRLTDRSKGVEREQKIHMNFPLYHNNFVVYQSSYIEGRNGGPDVSIFSVAKAPGTPVIYVGSIVMVAGMALCMRKSNVMAAKG